MTGDLDSHYLTCYNHIQSHDVLIYNDFGFAGILQEMGDLCDLQGNW